MTDKIHSILDFIIDKKFSLAGVFFAVSFVSFSFLYGIGLIPEEFEIVASAEEITEEAPKLKETSVETASSAYTGLPEFPTSVRIPKVGVNASVANPSSANLSVLDEALKHGAVRYPSSGRPGKGNMLIFAHSTSIKVVNNQAYKAFNGIQNLAEGDEIVVDSAKRSYIYKVTKVMLTEDDQMHVNFNNGKNMLTLSTCNVLGAKEERYVVEAVFVKAVAK